MNLALTRDQVRRVDDLAINRYHIAGIVLMENAGRGAAELIHDLYGVTPARGETRSDSGSAKAQTPAQPSIPHRSPGSVFIACGPGNNGGDGFVIARHLHNAGWSVRVMLAGEESRLTPDARANFRILQAMELNRCVLSDLSGQRDVVATIQPDEIVVDALLGTGFRGQVRSPTTELIEILNAAPRRAVVAIDVPSGLDCDTGAPSNAVIRADLTVTFVAPKMGFASDAAGPHVGRVEVVSIGAPPELVAEVRSG